MYREFYKYISHTDWMFLPTVFRIEILIYAFIETSCVQIPLFTL